VLKIELILKEVFLNQPVIIAITVPSNETTLTLVDMNGDGDRFQYNGVRYNNVCVVSTATVD